ncbi:MAG: DUF2203 domain-containing protein [Nitrososphaerota archaeon]|jgi:hypothetical protein|nr:DUF2203 domain-containing protein [Nitrososphaerota archaeon]
MPHLFTPDEANKKLPEVRRIVSDIIDLKRKLGDASLNETERASLFDRMTILASKLAEQGIELKDTDIGLIDFPAKRFDEVVYLCWKLGEPEVLYWHGLKDGYRGRKSLRPQPTTV